MPLKKDYNLRPVEDKDLEIVLEWRNSEHIRANMYSDHIINADEHQAWYNRIKQDRESSFNIFEYQQRPLGIVQFNNIDKKNNNSFWGFYLGEQNLPKGTGLVLGYFGLTFGFEKLELRKIIGESFVFNTVSVNFHKKLGFVEEGRYKKHILKNGNYEDIVSFAIFIDNWVENKVRLENLIKFN